MKVDLLCFADWWCYLRARLLLLFSYSSSFISCHVGVDTVRSFVVLVGSGEETEEVRGTSSIFVSPSYALSCKLGEEFFTQV